MIEAGGSFRFTAKPLQVRFGGPGTEADHLQRDGAIETFLTGAINHALTATADFLQQLVVAKVARYFCCIAAVFFPSCAGTSSSRPGSTTPATASSSSRTRPVSRQASRANFPCCVTGDFCSAPSANPDYTDHELTFSCGSGGGRRT